MTQERIHAIKQDSLRKYLARQIAGEVRFDGTSRKLYATDASHYQIEPLGVVLPRTVEDLRVIVQVASELNVPITPRGGGTSLSGQSIGPGIVVDCSKYLNQICELNPDSLTVRVQPGVVLEHLNNWLVPHALMFGPDVATVNRATLGGMIGNNSAGARSVRYGQTVDHVSSLKVVLGDGKVVECRAWNDVEHQQRLEKPGREGEAYRTVQRVIAEHAEEIDRRFPKILRRVSGYNLPGCLLQPRSLVPLLVGSEGTLGVLAEAELKLVPRPKFRGLLVPQFDTLRHALDAVGLCLSAQPSAVELMDNMLIRLARQQSSLRQATQAIQGNPAALLMVEFFGETASEVLGQVERLSHCLRGVTGLVASVPAVDPSLRDPLWALRGAAVPLLYGMPGDAKPITFVEDCAVSPERMPEFASRFREIFRRHGTDGAFYGHASVGCLHIRPVLNLHRVEDVRIMRQIMEAVTDLVLEFHGSLSGEHGDGLVRSEWNAKMFGPRVMQAFRDIKQAFDPENIFNPGKIVNGPPMEQNWRLEPGRVIVDPPTLFDYSRQGGLFRSIELCNGAGVCRKTQGGAMCPSYRATHDEQDSTRGRANALRHALDQANQASLPKESPLNQRWLAEVMNLCLSCKACKTECPSNVDMAKLKAEFQQAYFEHRPRPILHRLVKRIHRLSELACRWAGLANWLGRRRLLRWPLQWLTGVDRRRSLPQWNAQHFRAWFSQRQPRVTGSKVLLLDDCFTTFQEPKIGRVAVRVLEHLGYQVEIANICCGRNLISLGYLKEAQQLAAQQVGRLTKAVNAGMIILGLEPSCLLTLVDEWTELIPGDESRSVARAAYLIEDWLADKGLSVDESSELMLYHAHCHQRALVGVQGAAKFLQQCTSHVQVLDAGCCGLAGSFGYDVNHYDLSVKIAELGLIPAILSQPQAVIIASGTSCRHQIRDLTGRIALHPIEVLARQLPIVSDVASPSDWAG